MYLYQNTVQVQKPLYTRKSFHHVIKSLNVHFDNIRGNFIVWASEGRVSEAEAGAEPAGAGGRAAQGDEHGLLAVTGAAAVTAGAVQQDQHRLLTVSVAAVPSGTKSTSRSSDERKRCGSQAFRSCFTKFKALNFRLCDDLASHNWNKQRIVLLQKHLPRIVDDIVEISLESVAKPDVKLLLKAESCVEKEEEKLYETEVIVEERVVIA